VCVCALVCVRACCVCVCSMCVCVCAYVCVCVCVNLSQQFLHRRSQRGAKRRQILWTHPIANVADCQLEELGEKPLRVLNTDNQHIHNMMQQQTPHFQRAPGEQNSRVSLPVLTLLCTTLIMRSVLTLLLRPHLSQHCNTPQLSASHCKTLQYTATHYYTLQHTSTD